MAAGSGFGWVLQVEDDANPGTYLTIGGKRNVDMARTLGTADTTSQDSNNNEEHVPTIKSTTFDFSGVIDEANNVQDELEEMHDNRVQKNIKFLSAGGGSWTGKATLTEFSISAPHDGEVTLSASLKLTAAVTKVAA